MRDLPLTIAYTLRRRRWHLTRLCSKDSAQATARRVQPGAQVITFDGEFTRQTGFLTAADRADRLAAALAPGPELR
jgi:hypothetical protein